MWIKCDTNGSSIFQNRISISVSLFSFLFLCSIYVKQYTIVNSLLGDMVSVYLFYLPTPTLVEGYRVLSPSVCVSVRFSAW